MKKLSKVQSTMTSCCQRFLPLFGLLRHSFVKNIFSTSREETLTVSGGYIENSGLGNCTTCKRFTVQNLLWSLCDPSQSRAQNYRSFNNAFQLKQFLYYSNSYISFLAKFLPVLHLLKIQKNTKKYKYRKTKIVKFHSFSFN